MNINKRLIGGFLGGGVVISVASLGGLKLSDKIAYDGQVRKFGTLRTLAHKGLTKFSNLIDQRIPKWEDDRIWKELYNKEKGDRIYLGKNSSGTDNVKFLSGPEDLRNTCYEIISKETKNGYQDCNSNSGWCDTCLFQQGWYGTSNDY